MPPTAEEFLAPVLTPLGHVVTLAGSDAPALPVPIARPLAEAFEHGSGAGLLHLGTTRVGTALPPSWAWWRDYAARYVAALCATPDLPRIQPPEDRELAAIIERAPPLAGSDYLSTDVLSRLWADTDAALRDELAKRGQPLQAYLKECHPAWNLVGRVHFNLAENRKDPDAPFAFLATYTPQLSAHGKAQHLPLGRAIGQFAGEAGRSQLLNLLLPVQRAAERCPWVKELIDSGELYHPLRWQPSDAFRFLTDIPKMEAAGVVVRVPTNWATGRPSRPRVSGRVGSSTPSNLGTDALLDFRAEVTLDGEPLTANEVESLLAGTEGMQWIRGRWVEVDRPQLERMLERFRDIERRSAAEGLPFVDAMRLVAGASFEDDAPTGDPHWSDVSAGPWLAEALAQLRDPDGSARTHPVPQVNAQLRPYQEAGVRWLHLLTRLRLGACLADDMGLGKTLQVLALLSILQRESDRPRPSLLVVPASLLANWQAEAERFCPHLRALVAHPSQLDGAALRKLGPDDIEGFDLVITSYGTLLRLPALQTYGWRIAVLDEAQAIKNPAAKQTRQVKKLDAEVRIALTGTPVENRLSDLWSIFDFTHPGLLGSQKVFAGFTKRLAQAGDFGPLRALVHPYILRRLKTDKKVIDDLPDKTELKAWCHLTPVQAALYQRAVDELKDTLSAAEGMARRGAVLSFLMRFKQICNHPSQWMGDSAWNPEDSGKFARLREIAETIGEKQEKVLVFTQFREMTEPLSAFLGTIFSRPGLVLHGATAVGKRRDLVRQFQEDELTPFFVLSLKAGGAGLNLTAASHVIHFDRWWNPAVENQATDRAFRIGQKRNVLVHKFVCRGTVEDRIDQLIESKQDLVSDVLEDSAEKRLTEMSDQELLNIVKLGIRAVQES